MATKTQGGQSRFSGVQAGCRVGVLLVLISALGLAAVEVDVEDEDAPVRRLISLMAALPEPPPASLREAEPLADFTELGPAIAVQPGQAVRVQAESIFEQGPEDGLEVLLCLQGGKNHEALAWVASGDAQLVKAAFILGLDLEDGQITEEESGLPARGTPVRVVVRWQPDHLLNPDRWVEVDASQLVRSRGTNTAYPPLPYVYTGSQIRTVPTTGPDGEVQQRERFMLEVTKSIAVNYDESDALLASPFALAQRDLLFEVNSALAPQSRTPLEFVFTAAPLPLTLQGDAEGNLSAAGEPLSDQQLQTLLSQHYGAAADEPPSLYAVAVAMPPAVPRTVDARIREHILQQAALAEVWVVPIFTLRNDAVDGDSPNQR